MTRALLDVNVLLALLHRDHVHHATARDWLRGEQDPSWASCAVTQLGFVRISSQQKFPHAVTVSAACARLDDACNGGRHEYWPCELPLVAPGMDARGVLRSKSVTDAYLLALAVAHHGRLVTFDRTMPVDAVAGASEQHLVVL